MINMIKGGRATGRRTNSFKGSWRNPGTVGGDQPIETVLLPVNALHKIGYPIK